MEVEEYQRLKAKLDSLQRTFDKLSGVLEQQEEILKKEFGCQSLKQADKLIQKYEQELASLRKDYEASLLEWESRWAEHLLKEDR